MTLPHRFHSGPGHLRYRVAVVTGTCRSGKTLLAQILGTFRHVEYVEEPWLPMMLPVLAGLGGIAPETARDLMRGATEELYFDRVLLRGANFRPKDQSSIWRVLPAEEVFERLVNFGGRDDVRAYTAASNPLLLLVLAETNPFYAFFLDAFPDCTVVHVVRNGFDVAERIAAKGWFRAEQLRAPVANYLHRAYPTEADPTCYLPWWVEPGDEQRFLGYSDFARGLYYWRTLLARTPALGATATGQYHELRYEDLVSGGEAALAPLLRRLDITPSDLTGQAYGRLSDSELTAARAYPLSEVPADEMDRLAPLLERYGYPLGTKTT